ncbi:MAG: hypothetical protein K0Q63_995 [Paenibacillus sp.]|jgi:membrane protein implicated in regulation of membrane protease activity|nr:hypothetical protein [Paenibacillus sp.]
MGKIHMKSSTKGVMLGASMTGGWLLADLLLPEPWGDVALFSAMAIMNIGLGWKLGKMFDQRETEETGARAIDAKSAANLESRS